MIVFLNIYKYFPRLISRMCWVCVRFKVFVMEVWQLYCWIALAPLQKLVSVLNKFIVSLNCVNLGHHKTLPVCNDFKYLSLSFLVMLRKLYKRRTGTQGVVAFTYIIVLNNNAIYTFRTDRGNTPFLLDLFSLVRDFFSLQTLIFSWNMYDIALHISN